MAKQKKVCMEVCGLQTEILFLFLHKTDGNLVSTVILFRKAFVSPLLL